MVNTAPPSGKSPNYNRICRIFLLNSIKFLFYSCWCLILFPFTLIVLILFILIFLYVSICATVRKTVRVRSRARTFPRHFGNAWLRRVGWSSRASSVFDQLDLRTRTYERDDDKITGRFDILHHRLYLTVM